MLTDTKSQYCLWAVLVGSGSKAKDWQKPCQQPRWQQMQQWLWLVALRHAGCIKVGQPHWLWRWDADLRVVCWCPYLLRVVSLPAEPSAAASPAAALQLAAPKMLSQASFLPERLWEGGSWPRKAAAWWREVGGHPPPSRMEKRPQPACETVWCG